MRNLKKYSLFYIICFFVLLLFLYIVFTPRPLKEGFDVGDFMKSIDVIYWINLDRAVDRKNYMDNLLSDSIFKIIPNIRISAVDGKMPDEMYKKIIKYNKQPEITDSEYGCLLSHLNTINTFSKSSYNNAIIFEDDISLDFKPYWKKNLGEVINGAPPDWDIIMLSYGVGNNGFVQNEYEKYKNLLELPKVQTKINLLISTNTASLRKQYRTLFFEEESRCIQHFKRGEKLMLLLVRYKCFGLAQLFHRLLVKIGRAHV